MRGAALLWDMHLRACVHSCVKCALGVHVRTLHMYARTHAGACPQQCQALLTSPPCPGTAAAHLRASKLVATLAFHTRTTACHAFGRQGESVPGSNNAVQRTKSCPWTTLGSCRACMKTEYHTHRTRHSSAFYGQGPVRTWPQKQSCRPALVDHIGCKGAIHQRVQTRSRAPILLRCSLLESRPVSGCRPDGLQLPLVFSCP